MNEQIAANVDHLILWLQTEGCTYGIRLAAALLILIFGALAIRILAKVLRKSFAGVDNSRKLAAEFVASIAVKVSWAFLAVIVLAKLGVNVGPLVAGLGVTGFVLGFAFQESLGSLASGVMIAFTQPFQVGDRVVVAGFEGTVLKLDMMAVVLKTESGERVTIPNKSAWGSPIRNFTALSREK